MKRTWNIDRDIIINSGTGNDYDDVRDVSALHYEGKSADQIGHILGMRPIVAQAIIDDITESEDEQ